MVQARAILDRALSAERGTRAAIRVGPDFPSLFATRAEADRIKRRIYSARAVARRQLAKVLGQEEARTRHPYDAFAVEVEPMEGDAGHWVVVHRPLLPELEDF